MLNKGAKGAEVKILQHAILELGFGLPRWGVDGDLGDETLAAVVQILRAHGKVGESHITNVSDKEVAFILALRDMMRDTVRAELPDGYYDCRMRAKREVDRGPRPWSMVKGICLHQTACRMGENAPRYDAIGAHFVVTRGGKIFHMHDIDRLVWHGNGWNAQTVGIEFDGLYAGIEGDPQTVWNDPSTAVREVADGFTPEAERAGQELIAWIYGEVLRHNGRISKLVSHRQASADRRNDPGSAIWRRVALPMMERFGLDDGGAGFKIGAGYPNPEAWDPARKGIRY